MKNINIYNKFMPAIKAGLKTSIICKADKLSRFKFGDMFIINNDKEYVYNLLIIRKILFKDLDDEIAKEEGYTCKEMLQGELEEIYDDLNPDTELVQIKFLRTSRFLRTSFPIEEDNMSVMLEQKLSRDDLKRILLTFKEWDCV